MSSYGKQTPINMTVAEVDSIESTYSIDTTLEDRDTPVSINSFNGSFTVPSGHYAKVSNSRIVSYFLTSGVQVSTTTEDNTYQRDVILFAGQKVSGQGFYLLFKAV